MEIQRSKLGRGTKKRAESLSLPGDQPGAPILLMEPGTQPLLRDLPPASALPKSDGAVDVAFQSLLSDANEELARLLQDVGAAPRRELSGDTQNRDVSELLFRAVRCAARQYMLQAELGSLALKDELTGLYNRRGFQALAERQLKLGRRSGRSLLLFFIDVDGLKQINDCFGHCEGDAALKRAARALKKTFRDSDIIARLGGDEFAVLAVEATGRNQASIRDRLQRYLEAINAQEPRYDISLSVGVARFESRNSASVRDLLAQADEAMYQQKRSRPRPPIIIAAGRPS